MSQIGVPVVRLVLVACSFFGLSCALRTAVPANNRVHELSIGETTVVVTIDGDFELSEKTLLTWIEGSANAVATYYGEFPVENATLRVRSIHGKGVRGGRAWGWNGASLQVGVGHQSEVEHLERDWVLVHEMVHLAMPAVERKHHWLEEGLSTYVEPLARYQVGHLPADRVWYWLVVGLPQGLPRDNDEGLDNTPTWGRTYWGGALFYFLADLQIREETGGQKSLQDALRGIVGAGGSIEEQWEIEKILAAGDDATGTKVLQTLYEAMKDDPHPVDLDKMFERLGVEIDGDDVITYNDEAPDAPIRRDIAH